MFRCGNCQQVSKLGEAATPVVVESRGKTYPARGRANPPRSPNWDWTDDPGGNGYETVKEIRVCPRCEGQSPDSSLGRATHS